MPAETFGVSAGTQPVERLVEAPLATSRRDHVFPKLPPVLAERIAAHGERRRVRVGEVLVDVGGHAIPFFLVVTGRVDIIRPSHKLDTVIAVHGPGEFTGEANMLTGRRSLVRAVVAEDGELIALTRERLLNLVQTDADLGQI